MKKFSDNFLMNYFIEGYSRLWTKGYLKQTCVLYREVDIRRHDGWLEGMASKVGSERFLSSTGHCQISELS